MPRYGGLDWDVVGLYSKDTGATPRADDSNGDPIPFTDADLKGADQAQIEFTFANGHHDYFTVHLTGFDYGWEELGDYVENAIDEDLYA